ncbi:MAG TPA: choice-of-anchor Q domain-containing protein [Candidatus Limnocylindrales bacterium]|nr:choice-of-anchor Q domain-containing protein [Candidatus Limnocylindrales bacterium]
MPIRRIPLAAAATLIAAVAAFATGPMAAPAHALAATYHVATTGSDATGDGSPATPWATITHALDNAVDDSLILVAPGTYFGVVQLRGRFETGVTVRSSTPYQARLRYDASVVRCYYGKGITLEGFDISHDGPGAGALLMQVSDVIDDPAGIERVENIVVRNNIFHDSYNNDLLKINDNARAVQVLGNMFYNQAGSDEHIDINSVSDVLVEGNVFFNDFAGSGRSDTDTSSYVVIKDSNANSDGRLGSEDVTVRRNVFLHWEGSSGQGFVRVGEDGTANFEAVGVLIENNLMLGNNAMQIRSPLQFQGVKDVTARANTIVGDMPAKEYGFRIVTVGDSPASDGIHIHNNIWSDPSGTMGDTFNRGGATVNLTFDNNLYWNDGNAFPTSSESIVEVADDAGAVVGDPLLPDPDMAPLPRWNPASGTFADGSTTIQQVFENLVLSHGVPAAGSAAIGAADPANMPADDILGQLRSEGGAPDIGAFEKPSCQGAGNGTACNDGNACTGNDQCLDGECVGDAGAMNGVACDDGNSCTGNDACSGGVCAGNASAADGMACDDGDPCSHDDVCAAGTCAASPQPKSGCTEAGSGGLDLRDRILWTWKGASSLSELGDPTSQTSYRLCIYDTTANVHSVAATTSAPAGGTCAARACWRSRTGRGYQYADRDATPEGLSKLKLTVGATGQASIKLLARGPLLELPALPLSQESHVVAQLLTSDAGCWQTTLPAPAVVNDASRFRDSR